MLVYPDIHPIALSLGPLKIHWYGLMYLIGFIAAWMLGRWRARRPDLGWTPEMVDDLIFYGVIGVVVGGRLGYMLFYGLDQLLANPINLLKVWEGGMSFHGGLLGVMVAAYLLARRYRLGFFQVSDFLAPLVPPGLFAGRIGNFINGELWGHRTQVPWGVQLPCDRFAQQCLDQAPGTTLSPAVHPSQLYEAVLEGMALFILLWLFARRPRPTMAISGLFLLAYGVFRVLVEFVRTPDAHIGYLAFGWLTMGQVLSLPMIVGGLLLMALAYRRQVMSLRRST
ncbi:prolipoprotein diacylglyceryl transferase [Caldichromatium japonicum]|uniref:Phosphatidylglycerol--prolipoprotein diacylglyceryl transferase n=1 Tax=Caldichromatium japonicum TaxID=2699430 RepID=A0A6G7VDN9_9GAMM|nr:prolipoprotein diacylglyceryl transferase [Caldichromatium japonicum]QIK37907.1 prolipoprotein diacylglyceryl transferase [Caldichromatium japonicum]